MTRPPPSGLTRDAERHARHIRRDTRPLGSRLTSVIRTPVGIGVAGAVVAFTTVALPATAHLAPILMVVLLLWASGGRRERHLPLRLPMSAGKDVTDYGNPLPGHRGYRKAQGMIYVGNAVEHGMQELWMTRDDALTHELILGATGSGKTVSLTGSAANYITMGGGLIYTDAKASKDLIWTISAIAARCGRLDDLLVINYMTGNRTIGRLGGERMTNTANPFATGSADDLVQILSSLIPTPEGDNAVFGERALTMLNALLYALVDLRDGGHIDLGVAVIRDYLPLSKLESLAEHPSIQSDTAKAAITGYLLSLPNWKPPSERIKTDQRGRPQFDEDGKPQIEAADSEANRQHGFAQMYFTRALSSLTDTYGHIYMGTQGEVDFIDVVRRRRILVILLPALEKAPAELANLGKINLSAIKGAIGASLGSSLEGTKRDVLDSLPTSSPIPSKIINDEYGYISVDGFAVVAAQARGLGFSVTFAGQDWAGIERGGKGEADQVWSNTRIKHFGKLLDLEGYERLQKAAGEAYTTETSGYDVRARMSYADSLSASVQLRSRTNITDLQTQNEGETHVLMDGMLIRAVFFYAGVSVPKQLLINRYLRVGEKTQLASDGEENPPEQPAGDDAGGGAGGKPHITRHVKQRELPAVENNVPRDMQVAAGPEGEDWRRANPEAVRNFRPGGSEIAARWRGAQERRDAAAKTEHADPENIEAARVSGRSAATEGGGEVRQERGFGRAVSEIVQNLPDDDGIDDSASGADSNYIPQGAVLDIRPRRESGDDQADGGGGEIEAMQAALMQQVEALGSGLHAPPGAEADVPTPDANNQAGLPSMGDMTVDETFPQDAADGRTIRAIAEAVIDEYPTSEMEAVLKDLTPDQVSAGLADALTELLQGTVAGGGAKPPIL